MKKGLILILLLLFITGCTKSEPAQSENTDSKSEATETSSFSQQESDLIRLNVGQSNYSNSVNLKGSIPGKMCYVEETDTLFFSDKDGLFQKTGEKTVKLLDTPVSALNVADGNLYFIIPEGETASVEFGNAYRMELDDSKTECIIDEGIINISVYKDRIFYRKITDLTDAGDGVTSYAVQTFKCGLKGEERTQISDFAFSFEGDICVTRDGSSINLTDLSNGTSEKLLDESNGIDNLSIYGDSLYYIRKNYNTLTNVLIKVNLTDKTVNELYTSEYIEDYGFVDGKLCVYDLVDFYLEENGKLIKYDNTKRSYKSVYTCGGKVYGISGEKLYEIVFNNDNGIRTVSENEIGGADDEE